MAVQAARTFTEERRDSPDGHALTGPFLADALFGQFGLGGLDAPLPLPTGADRRGLAVGGGTSGGLSESFQGLDRGVTPARYDKSFKSCTAYATAIPTPNRAEAGMTRQAVGRLGQGDELLVERCVWSRSSYWCKWICPCLLPVSARTDR